jgi:hypothetical protein
MRLSPPSFIDGGPVWLAVFWAGVDVRFAVSGGTRWIMGVVEGGAGGQANGWLLGMHRGT